MESDLRKRKEQAIAATVVSKNPGKNLWRQVSAAIPVLWTVCCKMRINICM